MTSSKTTVVASNPLELEYIISDDPSEDERAIFDYLTTYLPAESSITANEAVQQIIALFPEHLDTTGTNFIYRFWQLVFYVGSQLDCQQKPMQRFIALLKALEILPDEIQGSAYPGRNGHANRLYYVLAFADQWRNVLNNKNPSSKSVRQMQNINGLGAYMQLNGLGISVSYALETITNALENEKSSESYVQAAGVWFTIYPSWIYNCCLDRENEGHESCGPLWTGWPRRGYSIPRWIFWRKRFVQICDQPGVEEETARICRDAVKGIDRVSKRGTGFKILEMCVAFSQKIGR